MLWGKRQDMELVGEEEGSKRQVSRDQINMLCTVNSHIVMCQS